MTPPPNRSMLPAGKGMIMHTLLLFAFGLSTLAFCIAIDKPGWFHIRPVSASAAAMARAGDKRVGAEVAAEAATPPIKAPVIE